jgi:hypothetical protein
MISTFGRKICLKLNTQNSKLMQLSVLKVLVFAVLIIAILLACTLTTTKPMEIAVIPSDTAVSSDLAMPSDTTVPEDIATPESIANSFANEGVIANVNWQFCYYLPDGTEIFFSEDTVINMIKVAGLTNGAVDHDALLQHGPVFIRSFLPDGKWFTILSSNGLIARLDGSAMVAYDANTNVFTEYCLSDICEFGSNVLDLHYILSGQRSWLDGNGAVHDPLDIELANLPENCKFQFPEVGLVDQIETPTPETTSSPDVIATSTAACQDFESEFPGTPCP